MRALAATVALALAAGVAGCGGSGTRTTTPTRPSVPRGPLIAIILNANGAPVARLVGDGSIAAATPDGAGGWFVAGSFTHLGGVAEHGLARVRPNGAVDPRFHGSLTSSGRTALVASGGVLYAAGSIGDTDRSRLLAIDAARGTVQRSLPAPPGPVSALTVDRTHLIVATSTSTLRARPSCIEAIDTRSGRPAREFAAEIRAAPEQGCVSALRLDGPSLYVAGAFRAVDGVARRGIAKLDAWTGRLVSGWHPPAAATAPTVYDVAAGGGAVIVGGSHPALRMFSGDTGAPATRWSAPGRIRNPLSLALSGDQLFVAGDFGGAVARIRLATGTELPSWHASPTQSAGPLAVSGSAALVALHHR